MASAERAPVWQQQPVQRFFHDVAHTDTPELDRFAIRTAWEDHLRGLASPGSADVFTGRLVWWFSLAGGQGASRRALAGANLHLFFGEDERAHLANFFATVQNAPAQQRQFLDGDAISSGQSEIGPDGTVGPYLVFSQAFKRVYARSGIVSEAGENELHL
jgi:hypothetical protein